MRNCRQPAFDARAMSQACQAAASGCIRSGVSQRRTCHSRGRMDGFRPNIRIEALPVAHMPAAEMTLAAHPLAERDKIGVHEFELGVKVKRRDMVHLEIRGATATAAPSFDSEMASTRARPERRAGRRAPRSDELG